jgi:S-adenosylmethionine:tRNA-ribosyltransferase-isomerase (queuine synthetase)
VAAPTAGLHLTEAVSGYGSTWRAELVVGLGQFKPVTVADPADYCTHREHYSCPPT